MYRCYISVKNEVRYISPMSLLLSTSLVLTADWSMVGLKGSRVDKVALIGIFIFRVLMMCGQYCGL